MLAPLPLQLAPPAPFPLVFAQALDEQPVAPGVERATYRFQTAAGPLVVHLVAVDPGEPSVRLRVVLDHDRLIGPGETISAMAARTGAVAGINGDFFDIGGNNAPEGVVVQAGTLVRSPAQRVALEISESGAVEFAPVAFSGSVAYGPTTIPLTGVNVWPPQGGASFLDAQIGVLPASDDVTLVSLAASGPLADVAGAYTVTALAPASGGAVR
ncbi:MAG: hypothetical protein ACREM2_07210, partial [Vulcanimicrobiaceae bacterium]